MPEIGPKVKVGGRFGNLTPSAEIVKATEN